MTEDKVSACCNELMRNILFRACDRFPGNMSPDFCYFDIAKHMGFGPVSGLNQ
jgi:hypothetical protein